MLREMEPTMREIIMKIEEERNNYEEGCDETKK